MQARKPLEGAELISCAKATAIHGVEAAADACGYGDDTATFEQSLKSACEEAGIHIKGLGDLVDRDQVRAMHRRKSP